jgi:hypothetical protein
VGVGDTLFVVARVGPGVVRRGVYDGLGRIGVIAGASSSAGATDVTGVS